MLLYFEEREPSDKVSMALQQVPDLLSDGSVLSFFNKLDGCASGFFATDSTPTTTVSGYEDQAMRPNGVAFQAGADAVDAQPKINVGALAAVADVVDCVGYCPDRQGRETPKSENGAGVSGAPEGRSADHGASSMDLGRYGSVASSASWEDAAAAEWVKMLEAPVYQPLADFSSESRGQMPSTSTSTGTGTGDSAKEMRKTAEVIIIIIMYIYHALINALSAHIIHINLNIIFYTYVEDSLAKTIYTKYYMETHTHTHTHNDCSRN